MGKKNSVPKQEALIVTKDLEKRYRSGKREIFALRNINLEIKEGEFVSLVGPSGAGKSTLVRLLIREELPSHGRIIISGRDIVSLKPYQLPYYRRKVGVIYQDYKLLDHLTVKENVKFALEVSEATDDEIKNRIPKILNLVGLLDRADFYPKSLSGGEKQRVAIARALIHSPKILIADEPTGNLDMENANDVVELLKRINASGALVLLATHNKSIVDSLNRRVITLKEGKIVSDEKESGYEI